MSRRWTPDATAMSLLTLAVMIAFFDVLFLGDGFIRADLFRYHFPMKQIVRSTILAGEFPWWNRFYSGGQPMAANPAYEIFYPGQWPILLGTYRFGFHLHIALHGWLAVLGMFALLRVLGAGRWASAIAAISFGLGGFFFGFMSTLPTCFVWSWTPLVLALLIRYWRDRKPRDLLFTGVAAGIQMLVGEPVALLQSWILVVAAAVWYSCGRGISAERIKVGVRSVVLAGAGAALIAAVLLVPAVDHLRDTARVEGLPYDNVVQFSTPPGRFLELLFPHFYGYHRGSGPYFWGLASHGSAPYFLSIYLGLAVAMGAIAALYARPRDAIVTLSFCGFWYAIALGRNTVLFESLYDAGVATAFRYPEKFLAIIILPLVVLGGLVLDGAIRGERRAARSVVVVAAIIATASATAWLASFSASYARWFVAHWKLPPAADPPSLIALSQRSWLTATLYAAVLLVLIAIRPRLPERLFCGALLLFTAADLMRVMPDVRLTAPAPFFEEPGIARAIGDDVGKPIFHIGEWYADTTEAARYSRLGDRYYWVARNALLPPIGAAFGVATVLERDYDETYLRPTRELLKAMMIRNRMGGASWWQPFAELAGAAYVLDYRDYETVTSECGGDFALSRPVRVGRARQPLPRYYFASHLLPAGRPDALAQSLLNHRFAQRTAFVEGDVFAPAPASVLRASERPASAEVEVEAGGRSLLVMNVTPHRYWTVTIDGKDVTPVRVNLAYQGVVVERGRHLVEMRYRNPLVIGGGVVSLVAIALAGAGAWLTRL